MADTTAADCLAELGIPTAPEGHHHRTRNFQNFDCPWCSPGSGRWMIGINLSGRACSCWSCGRKPVVEALVLASGRSYDQVRTVLAPLWGDWSAQNRLPDCKPTGKLTRPAGVGELLLAHRKYLASRGLDPDECAAVWKVGGIGWEGTHAWRLYLPVFCNGKEVSWTTRSIADNPTVKYLSAPSIMEAVHHKDLLYGEDLCGPAAVLVEGPLDAIAIGPGAVATMGVGYTPSQMWRFARFPTRVICFDSDPAGRKRSRELAEMIGGLPGRTVEVELESAKDPGSASRKELRELRRKFLE